MSIKLEYIELLFKELNESQIQKIKTKYQNLKDISFEDIELMYKYAMDNMTIKQGMLLGNTTLILEHCFPNGKDENGNPKFYNKELNLNFILNTDLDTYIKYEKLS